MAEDIKVDLEQNSKYRVAFELMEKIAYWESETVDISAKREYYLRLYQHCFDTVQGRDIDRIVAAAKLSNPTAKK